MLLNLLIGQRKNIEVGEQQTYDSENFWNDYKDYFVRLIDKEGNDK